jgi:hypothetical protein
MIDLRTATLRASPEYEVVPVERLSEPERLFVRATAGAAPDDVILRPTGDDGRLPKTACHRTAELIRALDVPGPLPGHVQAELGAELQDTVAALVLDRVLEVEWEGRFLSGPGAQRLVLDGEAPEADGVLARLSMDAIDYGAALHISSPTELATRLYCYGILPLGPRWRRRLGDPAAAVERRERALARGAGWTRVSRVEDRDPWIAWHRRGASRGDPGLPTYKLYVSPRPESLPEVLGRVLDEGERLGAFHVKVGGTLPAVLRPDKLVLYFTAHEDLRAAANILGSLLDGCPAHGVPFTAELTPDGLLSWGIDPSGSAPDAPPEAAESWRVWVCSRLAVALIAADDSDAPGVTARDFALRRIAIEGVDVATWTPLGRAWHPARGAAG